jgi:hypothetical protein
MSRWSSWYQRDTPEKSTRNSSISPGQDLVSGSTSSSIISKICRCQRDCLFNKPWHVQRFHHTKLSPRSGSRWSQRRTDPILVVVPYRGLTFRHRLGRNNIPAARDMHRWTATSSKKTADLYLHHASLAGRRRVLSAYQYIHLCTPGRPTRISFASSLSINNLVCPAVYLSTFPPGDMSLLPLTDDALKICPRFARS